MSNIYDLVIIGAGPSGLSAAIYSGRASLKTLVIHDEDPGGQIKITSEVVNYPGIISTSGDKLGKDMMIQAKNFGVEFLADKVSNVNFSGDLKKLQLESGKEIETVGVIISTGAKPRSLGFKGEKEFKGRGVGYCATCDGEFFKGLKIFVVGAGFAAAEEAIYLTRFSDDVHIIAREPEFTCSQSIADKVKRNNKITISFNTEVEEIGGEQVLKYAKFKNNITNETWEYNVKENELTFGVFVFVGYEPISEIFKEKVEMNKDFYIITDENMKTNINGVYAAGDIRPKQLRQLVTAVSDGAIASTSIEKYIADKKEELNLVIEKDKIENSTGDSFLDDNLLEQLTPFFEKFENEIFLNAVLLNDGEEELIKLSKEMKSFLDELKPLSNKININIFYKGENKDLENKINTDIYPVIAIANKNNEYSGLSYSGVPGGHEFNSFIIGLYNVAGPGQETDKEKLEKIMAIDKKIDFKILVSLSCTMCPDLVMATQFMASKNKNITAQMIDLVHYEKIKQEYSILSVPALITNNILSFGKKNVDELLAYIDQKIK